MIQANELRIGNLFYPIDRSAEVHLPNEVPFVVAEVELNRVKCYRLGKPLHQVISYDILSIRDISPIPLTEEWLIRMGFKYNGTMFSKSPDCVVSSDLKEVSIHMEYCYEDDIIFKCPKHVHQLQNLYFALTGKELKQEMK